MFSDLPSSVERAPLPDPCSLLGGLSVCFIAGTLGQGGAERQLFYMLQALRAQGTMLRLLSLTRGEFWEHRIRELGVPVDWVGERTSRLVRLLRIIKEVGRNRPNIVQSSHFFTNPYTLIAARWLGLPEIGAVRADVFGEMKTHGVLLGRFCLNAPRWLAANSQSGIQNATSKGVDPRRCSFLPNVVDTKQFAPAAKQETGIVRLLCVGRLVKQKRVDRFLDVLAETRKISAVPVHGLVVGDGPLLQSSQEHAGQLGLLPNVIEFRSAVPDMAPIYREADIFVLTSDWEGTPNVVLEASACGLPVVATRANGTAEVVRDGETGYLFDMDDRRGITAAVVRLSRDSRLRRHLGQQGRRFMIQNHSLDRLSEFLAALYLRVTLGSWRERQSSHN